MSSQSANFSLCGVAGYKECEIFHLTLLINALAKRKLSIVVLSRGIQMMRIFHQGVLVNPKRDEVRISKGT
jgi:hypothetical protein